MDMDLRMDLAPPNSGQHIRLDGLARTMKRYKRDGVSASILLICHTPQSTRRSTAVHKQPGLPARQAWGQRKDLLGGGGKDQLGLGCERGMEWVWICIWI